MVDTAQFPSPVSSGSKKTWIIVVVVLVIVVILLIAGIYAYRVYQKPGATTADLLPGVLKGDVSNIDLKTEYQNPFDKDSQYVNPFDEHKSPFQSLQ